MSTVASADPSWVQWPGNGHFYAVIVEPAGISWSDAQTAAQALEGQLASITSAAENEFVFNLIDDSQYWRPHTSFTEVEFNMGPWIGGHQPAGASEPNGGWEWTTGEQFNFTAWVPGEPNEGPIPGQTTENRACFWVRGSLIDRAGQWNDFHDSGCWEADCVIAYVVERGCVTSSISGPAAQTVCPGGTASFTVSPGGNGPFTYQWQKGGQPLVDDAHISGSETATLTITGASATDAGSYACLVADSCGPVLSAAAELLISGVIIDGPVSQSVCLGGIAIFSVTPAGAGPFTYQWQRGGQPLADDAHITGSETATLTITGVTSVDVDSYACSVTDPCGPALSAAVELSITPEISIEGPAAQSACTGGTAVFTVIPSGPGPFTFEWRKGGLPLVDDSHISGSDTATLTITNVTAADVDSYACLVADSCGSALSSTADLSIITSGSIDGPAAQAVCLGGTATFSVVPTGAGPFTFAWERAGQPLVDDAQVSGSSTATLIITDVTAANVDSYACLVTDSCGSMLSAAADLLVIPAVNIDGPASQFVCAGGNASFAVSVTPVGAGPFTYAWQKGGQPLSDDAHISGSDEHTLTITGVAIADADSYACLVTDPCGSQLSTIAELVVSPAGTGDGDGSESVDGLDIAGFVAAVTGSPSATPAYCAFDMDLNGLVNAADLSGFIAALLAE